MGQYSKQFEIASNHAMYYEVGGFWKLTPEVEAGLCGSSAQRRACGYVNDPDDAGGETKFGISKRANPDVDIKALTWAEAKAIYHEKYWLEGKCDKMSPRIAILHFDGCVNHGVERANIFLQRALGVTTDGKVGPVTLGKLAASNELFICGMVCKYREQFYRDIVTRKPTQAKFLGGWLRRINEMRAFVMDKSRTFK
jgi:lysozyme family protein